jgi:chromate reductase, NAD(P)H dehydrogenase (quinone)
MIDAFDSKGDTMVRIAILLGSARPDANSAKVMNIIQKSLAEQDAVTVDIVDPRHMDLPVPGPERNKTAVETVSQTLQTRLKGVHGIIMVTPEYDGTISAVMKLLIEYLGYPSVLYGKPVILIGIAGGRIGAHRALEHLRSIATHIGCHVLPGSVSVGGAFGLFGEDGHCREPETQEALIHAAHSLVNEVRTHGAHLAG